MHRFSLQALIGALFMSFTTIIGGVYGKYGTRMGTIGTAREGLVWILLMCVLIVPYYLVLRWFLEREHYADQTQPTSPVLRWFGKHALFTSFVILLLVYAPYLWVHYPASVTKDAYHQIDMALGLKPYQSRHPLFSTLVYKLLYLLGSHVNRDFGIFCCVLFPTIFAAYAFARCISKVGSYVQSPKGSSIALLFYGGLPAWGFYMQSMTKDTLFFPVFLLFAITYLDVVDTLTSREANQVVHKMVWARLLLWGLLATLLRHGVILIVTPSLVLLALVAYRQRRLTCIVIVALVMLHFGCAKTMEAILKPVTFPTRAIFSIPFQQTARCMLEVPDSITDEEYEAIDAVLKASKIASRYKPMLSDPVKDTFRAKTVTRADILRYLLTWFKMMLKYPRLYFDAFFQYTYGYLDPFHLICATTQFKVYMSQGDFWLVPLNIDFAHSETLRNWFDYWGTVWLETPICAHLLAPGSYTWAMLICFLQLWSKKRCRQLVVFSLPVFQVLLCMASPVSGHVRYALPLMAITPLVIAWTIKETHSAENEQKTLHEASEGVVQHGKGSHLRS